MYQFTEDCMVGVKMIDDEHRYLFDTMNEIAEILKDTSKETHEIIEAARKLMETLEEYAQVHFADEEAYMKEIRDPELPRQKREHLGFIRKVKETDINSLEGENAIVVLQDLMEFLSRWLYRHILSSDTMIGKLEAIHENPVIGKLEAIHENPVIGKLEAIHENPVMLTFSDKYLTGIEQIDREHKQLFDILMELNTLNTDEFLVDKFDQIANVLEELKDYTVKHFEDEERYMREIGYAGLEAQQRVHQAFIDKIEGIDLDEVDDDQQGCIDELVDFLATWLINHILKMDHKIPAEN